MGLKKVTVISDEVCTLVIPCNEASLSRARHGSPLQTDDRPLFPTTTESSALEFETAINEFDGFYHKLIRN